MPTPCLRCKNCRFGAKPAHGRPAIEGKSAESPRLVCALADGRAGGPGFGSSCTGSGWPALARPEVNPVMKRWWDTEYNIFLSENPA